MHGRSRTGTAPVPPQKTRHHSAHRPAPSQAPDPGRSPAAADPRRWPALILLCLAQFMLVVDVTVVNVALPSMARDLGLGRQGLTWVAAAYTLTLGSLLLLGGRLADGLGRRRAFLTGMALFTAASLMSGLSDSGAQLVAGRAAQGVGAALLSPAALSIITTTFHGPERTRALGVWGAIAGGGAAVGVLVGGALTSGPGWHWIFFVNIPVGLAVLLALPHVVPATPPARGLRGLDVPGALTLTAAAGLLVYGLIHAGDAGWSSPATMLALGGAAVAGVAAVAVERAAHDPLVPRALARDRAVTTGAGLMLAATAVLITAFFLISWYLQHRAGYSALKTGVVYLPVAVSVGVGAHLASHIIGHVGYRRAAVVGFSIAAVGGALLSRLPAHGNAALAVLPGFLLLGIGLGAAFVTAQTSAMRDVDAREAGLVSAVVNTGHEFGSALGVALASVLAASSLGGATAGVGGFRLAFAAAAGVALATGIAGARILPAGRPDPDAGPISIH